jgi:hypothetical protein
MTVVPCPVPILKTSPTAFFEDMESIFASTMSATLIKSLICRPSPKITGFRFFNTLFTKIVITPL